MLAAFFAAILLYLCFFSRLSALGFVGPTQQWRRREQGRPAQLWRFMKHEPVLVKTFVAKA